MKKKRLATGEVLEIAIWMDGKETLGQIERFGLDACAEMLNISQEYNVTIRPPTWTVKRPGEDRVPQVPDHISGPDVRLLVVECEVVAQGFMVMPQVVPTGIIH